MRSLFSERYVYTTLSHVKEYTNIFITRIPLNFAYFNLRFANIKRRYVVVFKGEKRITSVYTCTHIRHVFSISRRCRCIHVRVTESRDFPMCSAACTFASRNIGLIFYCTISPPTTQSYLFCRSQKRANDGNYRGKK